MYDRAAIIDRLKSILEALERIPERFQSIATPTDFLTTSAGREHLDSICMVLLAVGESFKQIDYKTEGKLLKNYPTIPWREVIALRNVLAHVYFEVDEEQIYSTCQENISPLTDTVRQMIQDLEQSQENAPTETSEDSLTS